MNPVRSKPIIDRMRSMLVACPDIVETTFTTADGQVTASVLLGDMDEDHVFMMSSALVSLCARIASELEQGQLDHIHIKGEHGYFVVMSLNGKATLNVLANKQAKLGLVFVEMRRALDDLQHLI